MVVGRAGGLIKEAWRALKVVNDIQKYKNG